MNVHWLEQTETDVPPENDWLSANELRHMEALRFPKRRADWRLGRWTAKRALAGYENFPAHPRVFAEIEIRPALSGAPEAFFANQSAPVTISLSHRSGVAICAIAPSGVKLGCDLEVVEPRSDAFVSDYFTDEEQDLVARASSADRFRVLALLWSAKESALKALREGLRLDTRCVSVNSYSGSSDLNGWRRLQVVYGGEQCFRGWWGEADGTLRTLVADPPSTPPIGLQTPAYSLDSTASCA